MVFPVVMYGCENLTIKKAEHESVDPFSCGLEGPLDCKEIKPVNPKENQSWILTGRTDAEAEAPTLWPSDEKNWLIGRDRGWDGHEFKQVLGVGDGRGSLACYSPWGYKELDLTEPLTEVPGTEIKVFVYLFVCF